MNNNNPNASAARLFQWNGSDTNTSDEEASLCLDILGSRSKSPLYATLIISLTFCVVGNSTICLIVARHYQLHTVTNANIVNMAVGHLLFSIFCVPSYLSILSQRQVSQWLCSCLGFSFTFFATGSTLALMLVAFERYYVIVARRNSSRLWTARTAKKSILATWLVALMLSIPWVVISNEPLPCTRTLRFESNYSMIIHRLNQCLPFLNPPTSKLLQFLNIFLVLLCFVLPLATVATLYCRMVGPLWQGYNQVRPLGASGHPKTIRYTAEIRTSRTMLLMFILFLCCWITYCFIAISNAVNFTHNTNETLTIASISLAFTSFSLDPIIYALRNPRISMILRGRNRKRRRVKFGVSEFATDGQRTVSEQTSKWIHGRCAVESTFETTASNCRSEEFRAPSTAQTASSSRQSGSVLSFSYHVGVEEEPT